MQNTTGEAMSLQVATMFAWDQVRQMLYLHTPKELEIEEVDLISKAIPMFVFLIALEWFVSAVIRKNSQVRFSDLLTSLMLGLISLHLKLWFADVLKMMYCYLYENYALVRLDLSTKIGSYTNFIGLMFMYDFLYYVFHRIAHEYHLVWASHRAHHSGEDYNLGTSLRQGMVQFLFTNALYMSLAFFYNPDTYMAHSNANTVYQFYLHTTQIGWLGPLEYVINTPSSHRMHHRPPGNCNYGGLFIIWDKMFNSFVAEDKQEDYYGLAKQMDTFDVFDINLHHFRMIFNQGLLFKRRVKEPFQFTPWRLLEARNDSGFHLWSVPSNKHALRREKHDSKQPISALVKAYLFFGFACYLLPTLTLLESKLLTCTRSELLMIALIQLHCLMFYKYFGSVLDGYGPLRSNYELKRMNLRRLLVGFASIVFVLFGAKTTPSVAFVQYTYAVCLDCLAFVALCAFAF